MQQLYSHRLSENQTPSLPSADLLQCPLFAQPGVEEGVELHLTYSDNTLVERLQL